MEFVCPTCRQEHTLEGNPYRPFCSERCKLIDLGFWMTERYYVAGEEPFPESPDSLTNQEGSSSNGK